MAEVRIHVLERLPELDPVAILRALPANARPVWLDESATGEGLLAWNPDRRFALHLEPKTGAKVGSPRDRWPIEDKDPARWLLDHAGQEHWTCEAGIERCGGWLGYLGFEAGHGYLPFPWTAAEPSGFPHAAFARYPRALWFSPGETLVLGREEDATDWPQEVRAVLDASATLPPATVDLPPLEPVRSAEHFQQGVAQLRDWIGQGELFQANLSHRMTAPFPGDPRALYAALRPAQPTHRSAYWEGMHGGALLSWSPETFLSWHGSRLRTRPIKGTASRHADPVRDAAAAAELEASEKERAELTMIVDMARNDLGQVAEPGSVRVISPGEVESFPSLFHRTATIEAQLRAGVTLPEILAATFPPASVTGAPKVRALQAIAELEGEQRGPYCGALGVWRPGADHAEFSVLIRTALVAEQVLHLRVGAGIVWDSDPAREWEETLIKARYLHDHHGTPSIRSR